MVKACENKDGGLGCIAWLGAARVLLTPLSLLPHAHTQMMADEQRGWAWTRAVLGLAAAEVGRQVASHPPPSCYRKCYCVEGCDAALPPSLKGLRAPAPNTPTAPTVTCLPCADSPVRGRERAAGHAAAGCGDGREAGGEHWVLLPCLADPP